MSNILNLQNSQPETPGTEKRSNWSIAGCRNSYQSFVACFKK